MAVEAEEQQRRAMNEIVHEGPGRSVEDQKGSVCSEMQGEREYEKKARLTHARRRGRPRQEVTEVEVRWP
jgi:hypothetical protein